MGEAKQYSKWGEKDEVGALNELTPQHVLGALKLIKKGEIFNLGHVLELNVPTPTNHGPFFYTTHRTHEFVLRHPEVVPGGYTNGRASMTCRVEMGDHTGTHIDALNHIALTDHIYNGFKVADVTTPFGTTTAGIDTVPPIFCRGILIDVAKAKSLEVLDNSYEITVDDIESALNLEKVEIAPATAVLIRTGWGRYWMTSNEKFLGHEAGIGLDAAKWLVQEGAVLVGSDNFAVEVIPHARSDITVHGFLLVESGVHIIENLALETLSRKGVYEFAFVCSPLLIKGGTGSPISPLAIV